MYISISVWCSGSITVKKSALIAVNNSSLHDSNYYCSYFSLYHYYITQPNNSLASYSLCRIRSHPERDLFIFQTNVYRDFN